MTLYRTPGTPKAVLLEVLNELSPQEIKTATGKGDSHFYKVSHPMGGLDLDLDDAAALDAALVARGKEPRFLPLFQAITNLTLARLGGASVAAADFERKLRHLHIEAGELAKAVDDALADNVVDQEERRKIAREAQDVIDCATAIREVAEPSVGGPSVTPIRRGA